MWTLTRLIIGSVLVSGIVFGAGHLTRQLDTQAVPDTPAIAVQEAAVERDDDDTPTCGADADSTQAEANAEARVSALAEDLKRAVANGHASEAAAERFLSEMAGYIRRDSAA